MKRMMMDELRKRNQDEPWGHIWLHLFVILFTGGVLLMVFYFLAMEILH